MNEKNKTILWYFETYSGSLDFEIAKKEFEMLPESEKEKIKNEASIYFDNMGFDYSEEESAKMKHRSAVRNYTPKDPKKIFLPEIEKEFDSLTPEEQKDWILHSAEIMRKLLLGYAKGKAARKGE